MKKIILFLLILIPFNVFAFDIKSKNVILYNLNDDVILYELNSTEKISIASMTKIMTCLVALEKIDNLNDKVIITSEMLKGLREQNAAVVGFSIGEEVTYYDLLYAMMLPSGADGAQALAISTYGSIDSFVEAMNERAKKIGLKNTHFANPTGLDDPNNYSSVKEVSIILKEALKNEEFKKIFTANEYITSNKKHKFIASRIKNNIDSSFLDGSKTGFTYNAGLCLASISHHENVNFLLVTANAPYDNKLNHITDAYTIYKYYFDNYSERVILNKNEKIVSITLTDGRVIDYYSDKVEKKYLKNDCELQKSYDGIINVNEDNELNDKLGEYVVKCNDNIIYTKDIVLNLVNFKENSNRAYLYIICALCGCVVLLSAILLIIKRR